MTQIHKVKFGSRLPKLIIILFSFFILSSCLPPGGPDWKELHSLELEEWGEGLNVKHIEFNSSNTLLGAVYDNGLVQIWDVRTGEPYKSFDTMFTVTMAFSPDGQHLSMLTDEGEIQIIDLPLNSVVGELNKNDNPDGDFTPAISLAWSSTGLLAVGFEDGKLQFWDVDLVDFDLSKEISIFGEMQQPVFLYPENMHFSPDGSLFGVSGEGDILLFEISNDQSIEWNDEYELWGYDFDFSSDSTQIASITEDLYFPIINLRTNETDFFEHKDESLRPSENLSSVSWSHEDPNYLAVGSKDGFIYFWDSECNDRSSIPISAFVFSDYEVSSLTFSPDSQLIAAGSNATKIIIWERK